MDDTHKHGKLEAVAKLQFSTAGIPIENTRPHPRNDTDYKTLALELAALLEAHKSADVTVLDFRAVSM
jgi:hypothetical protein